MKDKPRNIGFEALKAVTIFWDKMSCSRQQAEFWFLPLLRRFLAWSTFWSWRWRRKIPPKHRLNFSGLHGDIWKKIKVKVKFFLCFTYKAIHHKGACGIGCIAPPFLTSALDGSESSASPSATFPRRKIRHFAEWATAVRTLWTGKKSIVLNGNRTPDIQSVSRSHTDWGIPAPISEDTVQDIPENSNGLRSGELEGQDFFSTLSVRIWSLNDTRQNFDS
jgi:hypothetical protein